MITHEFNVDLWVNFDHDDEFGYLWAQLSDARDPSVVTPERVVVVCDDETLAMARVVDVVELERDALVRLDILPGNIGEYVDAVLRAVADPCDLVD